MSPLNEHLEHQVGQVLKSTEAVSSQRITVRADEGRVKLVGEVPSFREKLAAQQAVADLPDVTSVDNLLLVTPNAAPSDQQIVADVSRRLVDSPDVSGQSIHVDAHNGEVTLTGYVRSDQERVTASDVARSVDGVMTVHDWLMVNPDRVIAHEELGNAIRAGWQRVIGLDDHHIVLSIVDESAQLAGRVDAVWEKEAAEAAVRRFDFVSVVNRLSVVDP